MNAGDQTLIQKGLCLWEWCPLADEGLVMESLMLSNSHSLKTGFGLCKHTGKRDEAGWFPRDLPEQDWEGPWDLAHNKQR